MGHKPNNPGKLSGVGIGPGDPEHITIKALKAIREADVLLLPAKSREECRAYKIAEEACHIFNKETGERSGSHISMKDKDCLFEPFPMKMDRKELDDFHLRIGSKVKSLLSEGKNVAFLTIGDPCIYSTFHYIESIVKEAGYETVWINGIPSYCASAGRLGISLAQNKEIIHIIPGSGDVQAALLLDGTKVIMKPSRLGPEFREYLEEAQRNRGSEVYWVSECGLEGERLAYNASDIPDDMGYMSVVVIRG